MFKNDFPIFTQQPQLTYLDSAATSLKPQIVIDAMNEYYSSYSGNIHRGLYDISERATAAYEGAREIVRGFINAKSSKEIIFTSGTTMAINMIAQGWGQQFLQEGDEIILSILEHHSNIVPWQLIAQEKKLKLKFIDCTDDGELKNEQLTKLITRKTKLIAVTHVSNVLGMITPLRAIIQKAHASGVKVLVDAAQSVPHMALDVQYLDVDFLAFSGHKMCGPTGIGVLYAKEDILNQMRPFFGGGDMIREVHMQKSTWNDLPWKFEAGTPPIAEAIGLGAAILYLQKIGLSKIRSHEQQLTTYAIKALQELGGITIFGSLDISKRSGVISFNVDGVHGHDVATILNEDHIAIRAGHHCGMPLMERLGVPATARMSFYMYNEEEDIQNAIASLKRVKEIFKV
ncbi:cysteine desulfurase [Candidatus Gracilibacteria bacterium]|nr:cysteine desulfurase [Candidatus Gracilibacteria bacterium]